MQIARKNKMVEQEVCSRIRLGGRWYFPGDKITLDEADAEVYEQRGLTKPVKIQKKVQPGGEKEVLSPQQIGVVTKEVEKTPESTELPEPSKESPKESKDIGMTKPKESNNGRPGSKHR